MTKEPGGIPETLPLRNLILDKRLSEDGLAQLLLFAADRRVHLLQEVIPALAGGKTVVCDRYYGSTRVYQSERGVNIKDILSLEEMAITVRGGRVEPDVTILLDVLPKIGIRRKNNEGSTNYFDEDGLKLQKRRRQAYLELAKELGWKVVGGGESKNRVFKQVLFVLGGKGGKS